MRLTFDNLPASFKGLKIVQLSDIHSGSLKDPAAVRRGVDMVLAEKPDLILFTGDLVNDKAVEVGDYQAIFARLKAPMGVYSTWAITTMGIMPGGRTRKRKRPISII
jgi:predicted MPP superfamily phosphohydrolase